MAARCQCYAAAAFAELTSRFKSALLHVSTSTFSLITSHFGFHLILVSQSQRRHLVGVACDTSKQKEAKGCFVWPLSRCCSGLVQQDSFKPSKAHRCILGVCGCALFFCRLRQKCPAENLLGFKKKRKKIETDVKSQQGIKNIFRKKDRKDRLEEKSS